MGGSWRRTVLQILCCLVCLENIRLPLAVTTAVSIRGERHTGTGWLRVLLNHNFELEDGDFHLNTTHGGEQVRGVDVLPWLWCYHL